MFQYKEDKKTESYGKTYGAFQNQSNEPWNT